MKKAIIPILLIVVIIATAWYFRIPIASYIAGIAHADTATQEAEPANSGGATSCPPLDAVPEPVQNHIGIVIDGTTSTAASFSQDTRADLVSELANRLPAKTDSPQNGVATVNSHTVSIVLVTDNSFAYGSPSLTVTIPGVRGLPERPSLDCVATGTYTEWNKDLNRWKSEYDAATAAMEQAVQQINALDLNGKTNSGIRSSLSTLASTIPTDGQASFLVASDLNENTPAQTAGNLGGHPLILVVPCPSGNAAACEAVATTFADWATQSLAAGPVTTYRPEQLATAMSQLFSGGTK